MLKKKKLQLILITFSSSSVSVVQRTHRPFKIYSNQHLFSCSTMVMGFSVVNNDWQSFIVEEVKVFCFYCTSVTFLMFLFIQRSTSAIMIRVKMVESALVCQVTSNVIVHRDGKEKTVDLVSICWELL